MFIKQNESHDKSLSEKFLNCTIPIVAGNDTWNKTLSSTLNELLRLTKGEKRFRVYRYQFAKMIGCCQEAVSNRLKALHELGYITRENVRSRINGKVICELFVTINIDKIKETKEGFFYITKFIQKQIKKAGETAKKVFKKRQKKSHENTVKTEENSQENDIYYVDPVHINLNPSKEVLIFNLNSKRIMHASTPTDVPAPVLITADAGLKIALKEEGSVDTLVIDTPKGDETEIISNQQGGITSDVSFNCTETGSVQRVEGEVVEIDIDDENRCVRVINDESAKGQKTTLSVDVDLTDRHKQIMKRYLIHSDHYETIFEQYCFYWFDVAEGKKAQKKNWHLTFVKWVINAVNWDTNEKLKKPMSREEKKAEFDYWDLLAKENQIPELYSMSLGMTIFYHKKLERMKYYDIIGYLPYTSGSIESFVEYAQKNPLRSKIVEAMGGKREEAEVTYDSWFGDCEHQPDNTSYDNEQTKFSVFKAPNAFMRDQINNRFRKVIDSLNLIIE